MKYYFKIKRVFTKYFVGLLDLEQLSRHTPAGEANTVFLPSDGRYDWMLAKMWVKSSDFNVHQLVTHFLRTHLTSEVFAIAMYRQLAAVHPVYKVDSETHGLLLY